KETLSRGIRVVPVAGQREVGVGRWGSGCGTNHVRREARQRNDAFAAAAVGESIGELPLDATGEAQRCAADRLCGRNRRRGEITAVVFVDLRRRGWNAR